MGNMGYVEYMWTYMPQMETRIVAILRDRTKGARAMEAAKIMWLTIHAVIRSGLYSLSNVTMGAIPRGGLGVKARFSDSGD